MELIPGAIPQDRAPQGMAPQGTPHQGLSLQGMVPRGMAQQGMSLQGTVPRGMTYGKELVSQLFSYWPYRLLMDQFFTALKVG